MSDSETDSEIDSQPPKSDKPEPSERDQSTIIVVCIPLMSGVHENIQQSGETTFCDSTSTLHRFNSFMYLLPTSHPAAGLYTLNVIITSDELEHTITQGLEMFKDVVPE